MKKVIGVILGVICAIVMLPVVFALGGATALAITEPAAGIPIILGLIFLVGTVITVARWVSK